jgi:dimeric dUTPase (all-alpha-NTP-PPase superfamily)
VQAELDAAANSIDFWVKLCEKRITSISEEYLKSNLHFDMCIDHTKFLRKLEKIDKGALKAILPKQIVRMGLGVCLSSIDDAPDKKQILTIFDNVFDANNVKIISSFGHTIGVEVWLIDDADIAAFEFYVSCDPDLFFY